jgi:hypothetical protein
VRRAAPPSRRTEPSSRAAEPPPSPRARAWLAWGLALKRKAFEACAGPQDRPRRHGQRRGQPRAVAPFSCAVCPSLSRVILRATQTRGGTKGAARAIGRRGVVLREGLRAVQGRLQGATATAPGSGRGERGERRGLGEERKKQRGWGGGEAGGGRGGGTRRLCGGTRYIITPPLRSRAAEQREDVELRVQAMVRPAAEGFHLRRHSASASAFRLPPPSPLRHSATPAPVCVCVCVGCGGG